MFVGLPNIYSTAKLKINSDKAPTYLDQYQEEIQ